MIYIDKKCWLGAIIRMGFVVLMVSAASCSHYKNIPPSEWDHLNMDEESKCKVTTSSTIYNVRGLAATDSTLVLNHVSILDEKNYPANSFTIVDDEELPLILRFDEVESVEHLELSNGRSLAFGGLVVVGGIVALYSFVIFTGIPE